MGEWLIGAYNGRLITATGKEKDDIWERNERLRDAGFLRTAPTRRKLTPYFFILDRIPEDDCEITEGDKKLLEDHGIYAPAFKYGHIKFPAFGSVKDGSFILDDSVVKKFKAEHGEDYHMGVDKIPQGRAFALALMSKDERARTGTLFRYHFEDKKAMFRPCMKGNRLLVGKGILLGIKPSENMGYMDLGEAVDEMKCPVSKLMVRFVHDGKGWHCTVYREVSTDLRADMPLALLKVYEQDNNVFKNMFYNFGRSIREAKEKFRKMRTNLYAWNVQLDGTLVDYADLEDFHIPDDKKQYAKAKDDLSGMLMSAALISAAGKDALFAMAEGWKAVARLDGDRRTGDRINANYRTFFKRFSEGAGKEISGYFTECEEPKRH